MIEDDGRVLRLTRRRRYAVPRHLAARQCAGRRHPRPVQRPAPDHHGRPARRGDPDRGADLGRHPALHLRARGQGARLRSRLAARQLLRPEPSRDTPGRRHRHLGCVAEQSRAQRRFHRPANRPRNASPNGSAMPPVLALPRSPASPPNPVRSSTSSIFSATCARPTMAACSRSAPRSTPPTSPIPALACRRIPTTPTATRRRPCRCWPASKTRRRAATAWWSTAFALRAAARGRRPPTHFELLARHSARFDYAGATGVRLQSRRPMIELSPDGQLQQIRFNTRSIAPLTDVPFDEMARLLRRLPPRSRTSSTTPAWRSASSSRPARRSSSTTPASCTPARGFSGAGTRWLQGCYADSDGLLSTLAALTAKDRP